MFYYLILLLGLKSLFYFVRVDRKRIILLEYFYRILCVLIEMGLCCEVLVICDIDGLVFDFFFREGDYEREC